MIAAQSIVLQGDIPLENGGVLSRPTIAYHTRGKLNESRTNVVWVCHALTANSDFESWWSGLFAGDGDFANGDWLVICANVLGSCYGTTGPQSINPETHQPYYYDFPLLTIRDLVSAHQALAVHLGIEQIAYLIGGSLGGQQALTWACLEPDRFAYLVPVATNAIHSPWGIAFNESQRLAITLDPTWGDLDIRAGEAGMKVARGLALLSYRNYGAYQLSQEREPKEPLWNWRAKSYQVYQGKKLALRFTAQNYVVLSHAMDSHDLGRLATDGIPETALRSITAKTLVISMRGDLLFPETEQARIATAIGGAQHQIIETEWGHDGFLLEGAAITKALQAFINQVKSKTQQQSLECR